MSKKIAVLTSNKFDDLSRLYDILKKEVSKKDWLYIDIKESKINQMLEETASILKLSTKICPRATMSADQVIIIYDQDYEIHKNRKNSTMSSYKEDRILEFEVPNPKR